MSDESNDLIDEKSKEKRIMVMMRQVLLSAAPLCLDRKERNCPFLSLAL